MLTAGFVVRGPGTKTVLIRAIGPTLGAFGVTNVLADPKLELYRGTDLLQTNDNWNGTELLANSFTQVGAFPLPATSEDAVRAHFNLPLEAMLDMGDFAGGLLKYIRANPVPRVTIGGGFGKMVKLAQGSMDLHSGRSQVDFTWLAERVAVAQRAEVLGANTAQQVLEMVGPKLAARIAEEALHHVKRVLEGSSVADIIVVDRQGKIIAHAS